MLLFLVKLVTATEIDGNVTSREPAEAYQDGLALSLRRSSTSECYVLIR